MKRRYTRARALENIQRIREQMGDVMITADLMVGFPGESDDDFLDTLRFVGEARLLDAHVFAYSKREGTPAASYSGQLPESVKRERSAALIAEVARVRDGVLDGIVSCGRPLMTVLEEQSGDEFCGHSDSYVEIRCKADGYQRGDLVAVRPVSHSGGVVYGKII
jgi:threonylcarbamoyladenosine tRNA methylthiotransferase MtaB